MFSDRRKRKKEAGTETRYEGPEHTVICAPAPLLTSVSIPDRTHKGVYAHTHVHACVHTRAETHIHPHVIYKISNITHTLTVGCFANDLNPCQKK